MPRRLLLPFLMLAGPALALDLPLPPGAVVTRDLTQVRSLSLPIGPYTNGTVETLPLEGTVQRTAWRIPGAGTAEGSSALMLAKPLRDALTAAGYTILLDCDSDACGGFDFRYRVPTLPEPDMHVDLGDFRFVAAERGGETVALMVSHSAEAGFVQLTRVTTDIPTAVAPEPAAAPAPATTDMIAALRAEGSVVLEEAVFAPGTAALAPGDYPALRRLAAWIAENPARRLVLVGHTDAAGSLAANTAVSLARAQAVRDQLVGLGTPADRIAAEGAGYLAPRASNLTEEGRRLNRRVTAVLLAAE